MPYLCCPEVLPAQHTHGESANKHARTVVVNNQQGTNAQIQSLMRRLLQTSLGLQ
jgi:hypothetical protein